MADEFILTNYLDMNLIKIIPEKLIRRYQVVPVKKVDRKLIVAIANPQNFFALDDLRLATNYEIEAIEVPSNEIQEAIERIFNLSFLEKGIDYQVDVLNEDSPDESVIVKFVNEMIRQAVLDRASDIHIEPNKNKLRVRYRIDGILHERMSLPINKRQLIVARLKIMSELDIAEKRVPQDGRFKMKIQEREVDLRLATLPTVYGEKIVIRILDKAAQLLNIEQLGFNAVSLQKFKELIKSNYGMLVITGPSGSGKSTTLYAALSALNTVEKNLVSIEEPVEYTLDGVNQTQVNIKANLTFAISLRSILRQDPDVIMIGEIRDQDTAQIAVKAASSGHLVLTTLHTGDAASALNRLVEMGVEPYLVSAAVTGVISQRLVRKLCPKCKQAYTLPLDHPSRNILQCSCSEEVILYQAKGCRYCNDLGYHGRVSIQELMIVTDKIRKALQNQYDALDIKRIAILDGMVTLKEDGIEKVLSGITSIEELTRVCYGNE